ncbi:MAG: type pilus modification protein PilV [Planctomycetaceae bacterium]|nr:type pilus modification protein PilV [Planctomycetaceae bacterium]
MKRHITHCCMQSNETTFAVHVSKRRGDAVLPSSRRLGATLSEVLVSLLIMAIGVISLASLFPISVLKTARANQLTIGTNVRYNAESMMTVYPHIYMDPNSFDSNQDGLPYNDYDFSSSQPYLFDPQGLVRGLPGAVGFLPRFGGGFEFLQQTADDISAGPDSWSVLHEGAITSGTGPGTTQITVDNLAGISLPNPPNPAAPAAPSVQMRVHLMYNGGKSSVTRTITQILPLNTLVWTEDTNSNNSLDANEDRNGNYALDGHGLPMLPSGFVFESAKLEAKERKYTWLAMVRPQDDSSSFINATSAQPAFDVTVVVYFGRGFSLEEEAIFGTPPGAPVLNPATGTTTIDAFEGNSTLTVNFSAGSPPFLKRGGYLLDAENGHWYQIQNYTDVTSISTFSNITLTTAITKSFRLAMFPRGVVDVFPIKPQSLSPAQ